MEIIFRTLKGSADRFLRGAPGIRCFYKHHRWAHARGRRFDDYYDPKLFGLPDGRWVGYDYSSAPEAREIPASDVPFWFDEPNHRVFEISGGQHRVCDSVPEDVWRAIERGEEPLPSDEGEPPVKASEERLTGSQGSLLEALGFEAHYTGKLKQLARDGEIDLRQVDRPGKKRPHWSISRSDIDRYRRKRGLDPYDG